MTLACLVSQFYIELGPAQPQLVFSLFWSQTKKHLIPRARPITLACAMVQGRCGLDSLKMSKTCSVSIVLKKSDLFNILDVFSGLWSCISLIPLPVCQASRDTSLEYPQQGILIRKIWIYFDVLDIFKAISDGLSLKIEFLTFDSQYHFHTGQIKIW